MESGSRHPGSIHVLWEDPNGGWVDVYGNVSDLNSRLDLIGAVGSALGLPAADITDARLSLGVYEPNFTGIDGYVLASDVAAQAIGLTGARFSYLSGLQGALFYNADLDRYVLAYQGTDPTSLGNLDANIDQAHGFATPQYTRGINIAIRASVKFGNKLRFAGHSLGGGIASAAAIVTGLRATTFNAASLHANTVARYDRTLASARDLVRAYFSRDDVVSFVQDTTPLPSAAGTRIGLEDAGSHAMRDLCKAMGC